MLADIENALISKLKASVLATKLRQVDTLPDDESESLVKRFTTDAPAIYVAPADSLDISNHVMDIGFAIVCVARNVAGQAQARKGDGKIIGLYEIFTTAASLLDAGHYAEVFLYSTGVKLLHDQKLYAAGLQVAVISLEGQIMLPSAVDESLLDDFETLNSQYDLPPHVSGTEHLKWLQEPADYLITRPEMVDHLTVEI